MKWWILEVVLSLRPALLVLEPRFLEKTGDIKWCMVNRIYPFNLHLKSFLTEDTRFNTSNPFGTVLGNVLITTLAAPGLLSAPLSKMFHLEALEALRGLGLEFGCSMVVVVEK